LENKDSLDKVMDASVKGAKEDIIPFTEYDDGYDLRNGEIQNGIKQKVDENGTS
jgi:hypothetical protein